MATKLQHTPTTNLFALLADEQSQSQQAAKKPAAPASTSAAAKPQELTPKARAEAKAAQDAERKKKEAEKKPSAGTEADLGGFSLQRNQRVKEKRLAPLEATKEVHSYKGEKKPYKGPKFEESKPFKENNRQPKGQGFKGDKPKNLGPKGEGNEGRPPRREFEKHSQGKFPRQPYAKKQGHGKGNWGEATETAPPSEPVEEILVPSGNAEDESWGTVTSPASTDDNQPTGEGQETEQDRKKEKEKTDEPKELGLDDFLKMKAEKQKELETLVGASRVPRSLTDEEKSNHHKFIMVENTKSKVPAKEGPKEGTKAPRETPAKSQARKGEKSVAVETVFNVQFNAPVSGGRGRGDRDSRERARKPRNGRFNNRSQGDNPGQGSNDQRAPRPAKPLGPGRVGKVQKIVKNDTQFPSLG